MSTNQKENRITYPQPGIIKTNWHANNGTRFAAAHNRFLFLIKKKRFTTVTRAPKLVIVPHAYKKQRTASERSTWWKQHKIYQVNSQQQCKEDRLQRYNEVPIFLMVRDLNLLGDLSCEDVKLVHHR